MLHNERVEIWDVSSDSSVALWPPEVAGQPRPGARELLAHPVPGQRAEQAPRIGALARSIQRGDGELTGDMMMIDEDGNTSNAFHRLKAIMESQGTLTLGVLLNATAGAIDVMDRGMPRSYEQRLKRRGVEHYSIVAPAARYLARWLELGAPGSRTYFSDDDADAALAAHPGLVRHALTGGRLSRRPSGGKGGPGLGSPGLGCALAYVFTAIDPESSPAYLGSWEADVIAGGSDPIHRLRDWLANASAKPGAKGGADVNEKVRMVILSFNAWRKSERWGEGVLVEASKGRRGPLPTIDWPEGRERVSLGDLDSLVSQPEELVVK